MRKIQKSKKSVLILAAVEDQEEITPDQQLRIMQVLSHPVRKWIYEKLDEEAMRQADLAKQASRVFKKQITQTLLRHHLRLLEKAGLVGAITSAGGGKIIYRKVDVRIQVKEKGPEKMASAHAPPRTEEEFVRELIHILKSSGGEESTEGG